jgi:hypothetical protein
VPVSDPRTLAAAYGLAVEVADLGVWEPTRLVAEYDARGRAIRVNAHALEAYRRACGRLDSSGVRAFIERAVAHELYHHREAAGEIARLPTPAQRERAAEDYARAQVPPDLRLEAFLRTPSPPL